MTMLKLVVLVKLVGLLILAAAYVGRRIWRTRPRPWPIRFDGFTRRRYYAWRVFVHGNARGRKVRERKGAL